MKTLRHTLISIALLAGAAACSDFVEIDPPRTDLIRSTIFESDETASAAMTDIYYQLCSPMGFASGGVNSVSITAALSSDEAVNASSFLSDLQAFNDNALTAQNSWVSTLWSDLYKCIYKANAICEGLETSSNLTPSVKQRLEGEARFIRAFCHFYLVNLFGDVPLILTTDYKANQNAGRMDSDKVYDQILADLLEAQKLLPDDYSSSNNERVRANRNAATALLARVYLFRQEWEQAEIQASAIIDNTSVFTLMPLPKVFLKNSGESILQLAPPFGHAFDAEIAGTYTFLQPSLINSFEAGDQRLTEWVQGNKARKYKTLDNSSTEYSVVLRLSEQYLIRAEARAQQDNLAGAQDDINTLRARAALSPTTAADKASLLGAIEQERRVELFMEWGHRWLDLKRTGRVNDVIGALKTAWNPEDHLYPIPEAQLLNDIAMKDAQNPGY